MKLWVVGKNISGEFPNVVWSFSGVFDTEELAVAACHDENYFVGSIMLNESPRYETTEEWPGGYYPKAV